MANTNSIIAQWLDVHVGECIIATLILWTIIVVIAFVRCVLRKLDLIR